MKEHYVSYSQAVKLKELGFDWPCYNFWALEPDGKPLIITSTLGDVRSSDLQGRDVAAPFLWQAQAWLRDCKGISVEPYCNMVGQWNVSVCMIEEFGEAVWSEIGLSTYELALTAGIDAALEPLTNKQTDKWKLK